VKKISTRHAVTSMLLTGGMVLTGTLAGGTAFASPSASLPAAAPTISIHSFSRNFSSMSQLRALTAKGKGLVGAILPDTVSSARYTEFDAPYLTKAFQTAGLKASQFIVSNAQGSDTTELTDAQSDIAKGASVLIMDPLDSGVGVSIETYAKAHGVAVIDYDRLTLGGSRQYYVSFNNVQVGKLIGRGLVACTIAWHVAKPDVIVMRGDPTDNNATLFAQGYNGVMAPYFKSGKWVEAATPAGTALIPNDENGAPIISYLQQTEKVKPKTFPVTGQDATLTGLQNILSGYQCGTAYKPIYQEAQAAAALAVYLRAGEKPPKALVNGTTADTTANSQVASVLLTPEWVTTKNMASTVIKDNFVPANTLCAGTYAAACKTYGISS
jgi:D-xylose transport system substrate-binding protein